MFKNNVEQIRNGIRYYCIGLSVAIRFHGFRVITEITNVNYFFVV